MASVDPHAAALLFRHKVLSLLRHKELIDHDRIALMLSWKHSGFSVHNSVVVQPEDSRAMERLVRYVMRSPVSLDRLGFDHETGEARLEPKAGADDGADAGQVERLDGDELVARVIVQIPDPKRHLIRSYGRYANAARAKRKREAVEGAVSGGPSGIVGSALPAAEPVVSEPDSAERKAARPQRDNRRRRASPARARLGSGSSPRCRPAPHRRLQPPRSTGFGRPSTLLEPDQARERG